MQQINENFTTKTKTKRFSITTNFTEIKIKMHECKYTSHANVSKDMHMLRHAITSVNASE